jgi:hypothetical protein
VVNDHAVDTELGTIPGSLDRVLVKVIYVDGKSRRNKVFFETRILLTFHANTDLRRTIPDAAAEHLNHT